MKRLITASENKPTISFWCVNVFGGRDGVYAYGAKIKDGDFTFPTNLKAIQDRIGEKSFNYYSRGPVKSFRTYSQLVDYLRQNVKYFRDMQSSVPSEDELIESGYDSKYYTL